MNNRGPNDGGIKRGDGFDTGDNKAAPNDGTGPDGSGVRSGDDGPAGMPTFDPSSEEEVYGGVEAQSGGESLDDLTIMDAHDPSLGLTNIDDVPADDWAANTGPTKVAHRGDGLTTHYQTDRSSTLNSK